MGFPGIPRQLRDLVREIPAAFKQSAAKLDLVHFYLKISHVRESIFAKMICLLCCKSGMAFHIENSSTSKSRTASAVFANCRHH